MTARDLARKAFWSDHPLTALFAIANGQWIAGSFVPAGSWSLRELREFAELLPPKIIENIAGEHA